MSILTAEYDVEVAKRVYGDERVEERNIEFAKKLLRRNRPIEEIIEDTGLTREEVEALRINL